MNSFENQKLTAVAYVKSDFPDKFGIPRQSGLCPQLKSRIIFFPEFRNPDALRGIESFSHLWIIWGFSDNETKAFSPTVRPPRLGGNERRGVFATRSPFRPNSLGLSCVKLERVVSTEKYGLVLEISGGDMKDGTPVYDVKPYIPYADCIKDAKGSFADENKDYRLNVNADEKLISILPCEKAKALIEVLSLDPRPAYHNDENRIYGFQFGGFEVKFKVIGKELFVTDIQNV